MLEDLPRYFTTVRGVVAYVVYDRIIQGYVVINEPNHMVFDSDINEAAIFESALDADLVADVDCVVIPVKFSIRRFVPGN